MHVSCRCRYVLESAWSYSDSLIHVCPHVFACMHTHTWCAYVSDVGGFCVGTRVSWQVDSWLSTCTVILTYMCTCVHMCGVFAGYCVHSCVLTNDTCMSTCVCLHVHICMLRAYVRRESGLCVYTFVSFTKNRETVAWMSLNALHTLFINVFWITWLCTTQHICLCEDPRDGIPIVPNVNPGDCACPINGVHTRWELNVRT